MLLGVLNVQAQQNDTLDIGFDATQRAFMKRYRHPDAVPFDTLWKNNLYFTLFGGMDRMVPRGNADFNTGPIGGIAANWQFKPSHALRAALLAGNFARKVDNEMLVRIGIQADYLLNVTSYTNGYNPGRLFEFLTVAGVGYQYSALAGNSQHVGELHLGVQFKLHPTAHVDFYLEPRITFLTDGIDHSFQKNWHKYDVTYGATVGMNYRIKAWKPFGKIRTLEGDKFLDNTFVSIAAGGQLQASRLTTEMGLLKSVGPHFSLSVGKWLIPAFGLRLSGFKSGDTWHKRVVEETATALGEEFYEMSMYAGGRLEGMLDATYFFNGKQQQPRFSVNVLAGGELGVIKKESGKYPARGGYTGFTGGVQLKYRLFDNLSLFVEPRTTLASFSLKTNRQDNGRYRAEKYTDNLFNLNVGIEIGRANDEERMARSLNRDLFKPTFFAFGGVGFAVPVQVKRYNSKCLFNYQAMAGAGRIFTPLSAVRIGADYGPLSADRKAGPVKYHLISGSADYLLNTTNLLAGYDPERKYDVYLLAGIVGSLRKKVSTSTASASPILPDATTKSEDSTATGSTDNSEDNLVFIGAEAGAHLSYKVGSRFSVFVEPKVRIHSRKLLMQSSIRGRDFLMSVHAGTSFAF